MSKQRTPNRNVQARQQPQPKRFPLWPVIAGVAVLVIAAIAVVLATNQGGATARTLLREISVKEAASMRDAGAFVLDVRQPEEWIEYHIPNATLIPLGELEARVNEVPRDKDVVVVCRSGNRSQSGRDILLKKGFTRVTSMTGGLKQWQTEGLPVLSGS